MTLPSRPDEEQRLFALEWPAALDTDPEEDFDEITRLVAACKVPIALVSFVDAGRQRIKSAVGLAVRETSQDSSFCAYAINQPQGLFLVENALADPRFKDDPLVVAEPHVRFYAGAALRTSAGSHSVPFVSSTICPGHCRQRKS